MSKYLLISLFILTSSCSDNELKDVKKNDINCSYKFIEKKYPQFGKIKITKYGVNTSVQYGGNDTLYYFSNDCSSVKRIDLTNYSPLFYRENLSLRQQNNKVFVYNTYFLLVLSKEGNQIYNSLDFFYELERKGEGIGYIPDSVTFKYMHKKLTIKNKIYLGEREFPDTVLVEYDTIWDNG